MVKDCGYAATQNTTVQYHVIKLNVSQICKALIQILMRNIYCNLTSTNRYHEQPTCFQSWSQ